jgi:hypothetical protein
MKKLPEFKCRASAAGQIATKPRSKNDLISATSKTFVDAWVKEQLFGRQKSFSSKQIEKGIEMEEDAIEFASKIGIIGADAVKNETWFEDDFFTGTPDVIEADCVSDIKCSWDAFTFPMFADGIPTKGYELQLQIYMHLTQKKRSKLVYCLMDSPTHLIEKEARRVMYDRGETELSQELFDEMKSHMTYSNEPIEMRTRIFDVDYNEEVINDLKSKVMDCRSFIDLYIREKLEKIG